ncbi:ABC transporter ATP-binding protein [Desulfopila inferna]|uniref:ABC transporter ATP-binding protein n=1 Tax=Desulfopila inferna TaxID=468528 RepID=UPI0019631E6F|nr:ABC transporter ATP-binding protein [Desulfopila inferna]MBM9602681.1 ABC transporter ATP-binding protein [Desulfopila inferna]
MTVFLATLHSPLSDMGGLALVDSISGLIYLQVDNFSELTNPRHLRGISLLDDKIYITTPTSIRIYTVQFKKDSPLFNLSKEILLKEWLLGGNLLGILASSTRNRIFAANNLFNSIDELSLHGDFIKRHFLHDLAPALFPLPKKADKKFRYGHIRHLTEDGNGKIFITVSSLNNSTKGAVINFDTGRSLLTDIRAPHSCGFADGNLIIQDCNDNTITSYTVNSSGVFSENCIWKSFLEHYETGPSQEKQFVRGLTVIDNTVFSGVWNKDAEHFPSHIISLDSKTGKQNNEKIFFPNLEQFQQPRVFFLSPLPQKLKEYQSDELLFFLNGKRVEFDPYIPVTKANKTTSVTDQSKTNTCENIVSDIVTPLADKSPPIQDDESTSDNQKNIAEAAPSPPSIVLRKVSLSYRRSNIPFFSFKKNVPTEFKALHDISFTVNEGETIGIIGRNGSGKSTISMVISGALSPDNGTVTTYGRIQLLSIGLGFQNELTGRDNVFINGALLGLSKKEILHNLPDIESFAELEDFMDQPVRTYSAGMRSRLGFAVATAVSPDILILDEVMSTGDAAFKEKANERMKVMRERTKTIILISHSPEQIKKMCSRVIWLHKGQVLQDGQTEAVLSSYADFCRNPKAWLATNKIEYQQS